jgi:hypothetical protein
MPTVLRHEGFEFRIRTNDHDPPHVHVFLRDGEAKIEIGSSEAVRVWNMRPNDVRKAEEIAREHQADLLKSWRRIHG